MVKRQARAGGVGNLDGGRTRDLGVVVGPARGVDGEGRALAEAVDEVEQQRAELHPPVFDLDPERPPPDQHPFLHLAGHTRLLGSCPCRGVGMGIGRERALLRCGLHETEP